MIYTSILYSYDILYGLHGEKSQKNREDLRMTVIVERSVHA